MFLFDLCTNHAGMLLVAEEVFQPIGALLSHSNVPIGCLPGHELQIDLSAQMNVFRASKE